MGRRYVLFLKYSPAEEWFGLLKAWELRDGRVIPMSLYDQRDVAKGTSPFGGLTEDEFLEKLRQAVDDKAKTP